MRILVVGGAGYIGSIVAAALLEDGHGIVVGDNLATGHESAVPPGAEFVRVDLLDRATIAAVLSNGFDAVLHFAALSLVAQSVADPARYFATNVGGSANLVHAMRAAGVRRLVFSSTAATYGEPDAVPITEDAPTRPSNPYGASKLAVDHLLAFEAAASGLGAVSLRYFNVAGAAHGLGERHAPETHLIPIVLQVAGGRRESVEVYGTDYPTEDGTAVRDYIHVADLARAHILALGATDRAGHRVYNLGNGTGFSVRQVIDAARRVTGHSIPSIDRDRRQGDPAVLVASSERIKSELGWVPERPSLEAMVADAWEFESATCST